MFQDLDSTLIRILDDAASPTKSMNADVSFITPDKSFAPGQATVDMFLYDVKENRELRDPTPVVVRSGNGFIRQRPPVRVDCSYIVTTWSAKTGPAKVAEEHQLLAASLLWLSRFPVIEPQYLQGSLVDQLYPLQTRVAQVDPNKNAGEFWDALAISPRPAFYLTVTIAMDLGVEELSPVVTTRISEYRVSGKPETAETWIQIGATVLTGTQPVAGAWVRIEDNLGTALTITTTDADGRFTIGGLHQGTYTLRVRVQGFAEKTRAIEVPSPTGNYDVQLS